MAARTGAERQQTGLTVKRRAVLVAFAAALLLQGGAAMASEPFAAPLPAELAMKSLPGYAGVAGVVLFQERIDKTDSHEVLHYSRIKVLTEEGKKYANVELGFASTSMFSDLSWLNTKVDGIAARTIHADGTIIPFTGKPYITTIEKVKGLKVQEKVFTLPDVEVGSILEYRYAVHSEGYQTPDWYLQGDLPVKAAHYKWYPTRYALTDGYATLGRITWFPVLPQGAQVVVTKDHDLELTVSDIPPKPEGDYLPPSASYTYRVMFNYAHYETRDEFWKAEGDSWAKGEDNFLDQNAVLKSATQAVVGSAATQDEKLRKIYAAVTAFENTDFTREKDRREEKAAGLSQVLRVSDLLKNKRGDSYQLTRLFVGMARAAGFNAYLMRVADRENDLFSPDWWTTEQFNHLLAIVLLDGKEKYFDPGSVDCPYGQLAWQYTFVTGLRQTPGGSGFEVTPGQSAKENGTGRIAELSMDAEGEVTGKIDLQFEGAPALYWRQAARLGDQQSLRKHLEDSLNQMLPKTVETSVVEIADLRNVEKPLRVMFSVKGTLGAPAGKRIVVPADVFLVGESQTFPEAKREQAVYFHYAQWVQDAQRIHLPSGLAVEAVPPSAKLELEKTALYTMSATTAADSFTTRRNYVFGQVIVRPEKYESLRNFYSLFEAKDHESVVLKSSS